MINSLKLTKYFEMGSWWLKFVKAVHNKSKGLKRLKGFQKDLKIFQSVQQTELIKIYQLDQKCLKLYKKGPQCQLLVLYFNRLSLINFYGLIFWNNFFKPYILVAGPNHLKLPYVTCILSRWHRHAAATCVLSLANLSWFNLNWQLKNTDHRTNAVCQNMNLAAGQNRNYLYNCCMGNDGQY